MIETSTSGRLQISAQVFNSPLQISQTTASVLTISHTLVYYVNPWWTEFVTSDGAFTLADGKMMKVLTELNK